MRQLSLSYANPNSGKNSAIIAWINFGNISLSPGETLTGLYVKFNDGSTLSFDLTNTSSSNILLNSTSVPVTSTSSFGYSNYTNISGTPALIADVSNESHSALFEISNISYLNSSGFHINDYTLYIADLYASNSPENLSGNLQQYITNGSPWLVEELIGIGSTPSIEITDESSTPITTFDLNDITNEAITNSISVADITYYNSNTKTPILSTKSPTIIQAYYNNNEYTIIEGFAIGIAFPNPNIFRSRGINLFR